MRLGGWLPRGAWGVEHVGRLWRFWVRLRCAVRGSQGAGGAWGACCSGLPRKEGMINSKAPTWRLTGNVSTGEQKLHPPSPAARTPPPPQSWVTVSIPGHQVG